MGIFVAWFLIWLAGSIFGPVQYHPAADSAPPSTHESSETGGSR